jgi:phosphohistidine phosphatase
MKTLTILRHAKSSWSDKGLADHDRPLNRRGEKDAPVMAARINAAGIRPSLIMSSPAIRAWHTARIVAKAISYPLEFLHREDDPTSPASTACWTCSPGRTTPSTASWSSATTPV